jgi:hypothetical protein
MLTNNGNCTPILYYTTVRCGTILKYKPKNNEFTKILKTFQKQ